ECVVHLKHPDAVSYEQLVNELAIVQQLITLCTFGQSYPTLIEFRNPAFRGYFPGKPEKSYPKRITCHFSSSFYRPETVASRKHEHLLPYGKIKEDFGGIISKWYAASVQ